MSEYEDVSDYTDSEISDSEYEEELEDMDQNVPENVEPKKKKVKKAHRYPMSLSFVKVTHDNLVVTVGYTGGKYRQNEGSEAVGQLVVLKRRPASVFSYFNMELLDSKEKRIGFIPQEFEEPLAIYMDFGYWNLVSCKMSGAREYSVDLNVSLTQLGTSVLETILSNLEGLCRLGDIAQ